MNEGYFLIVHPNVACKFFIEIEGGNGHKLLYSVDIDSCEYLFTLRREPFLSVLISLCLKG
jgi:hypothetical protein